jgi:hypothetical protein
MSNNLSVLSNLSQYSFDFSIWSRKKFWIGIYFFLLFPFFLNDCGLDVEDPTPPSPPQWVPKSFPQEWPESGLDAEELGGIKLEWESSIHEDISAYHIYRAIIEIDETQIDNYVLIARLENKSMDNLTHIDYIVSDRVVYSYKLRAEGNSDNFSDFSETVSYSLLPQIRKETMIPNGVNDVLGNERKLRWIYSYGIEMENYTLTILSENNELIGRRIFTPMVYTTAEETWSIPMEFIFVENHVYKWRIDTGADYLGGFERKGSESEWAYFVYCCHQQ